MELTWHIKRQDIPEIQKWLEEHPLENADRPVDAIWTRWYGDRPDEEKAEKAIEIMKLLYNAGARIDTSALYVAVNNAAPINVIKAMSEYPDCDLHGKHKEFETPFMYAIVSSRFRRKEMHPVIRSLLELGANPNHATQDVHESHGIPPTLPLHMAIAWHDMDLLCILLEYGARMFIKDLHGFDALTWATHQELRTRQTLDVYRAPTKHQKDSHDDAVAILRFVTERYTFENLKKTLHKELVEYVFHPARLERIGYFQNLTL